LSIFDPNAFEKLREQMGNRAYHRITSMVQNNGKLYVFTTGGLFELRLNGEGVPYFVEVEKNA